MSATHSLLFVLGLFFWPTWLNANTPTEVIRKAVEQLGALPANDEAIAQAAAASLDTMNSTEVSAALYAAMKRPQEVTNQRRTLNVLVGSIKSFDIDSWLDRLEAEADPFMLNYGVRIADLSTKGDSPRLKAFKLRLLSDKRIGQELHGEARAYASKGLRICDIVMNSLWSVELEAERPPGYPVDAGTSRQRRDEMISAYAKRFNVPIAADVVAPPAPEPKQAETSDTQSKKEAEAKPTPPIQSEEPASSTPWSIIVALSVAAGGLLWLFLKRRS